MIKHRSGAGQSVFVELRRGGSTSSCRATIRMLGTRARLALCSSQQQQHCSAAQQQQHSSQQQHDSAAACRVRRPRELLTRRLFVRLPARFRGSCVRVANGRQASPNGTTQRKFRVRARLALTLACLIETALCLGDHLVHGRANGHVNELACGLVRRPHLSILHLTRSACS